MKWLPFSSTITCGLPVSGWAVEPVVSMAALTPLLAQRSIGRRSSMLRKRALAKCCAAAADSLNQPSLVTFTITCGPGRRNSRVMRASVSSKQIVGIAPITVPRAVGMGSGSFDTPGVNEPPYSTPACCS